MSRRRPLPVAESREAGSSDRAGTYPKDCRKLPHDVLATIYRHLGINAPVHNVDTSGRPNLIRAEGNPIGELFCPVCFTDTAILFYSIKCAGKSGRARIEIPVSGLPGWPSMIKRDLCGGQPVPVVSVASFFGLQQLPWGSWSDLLPLN